MEQFADDLAALLDKLDIDAPVTLCGVAISPGNSGNGTVCDSVA
jgi:hypothetical protein